MATITATVNTGGGGDFTSLNAARAALAQDLRGVTCSVADADGATTIALDITCTGSTADSTVTVFGAEFTTDATHRIRIRTAEGPTGPKWDATKYRLTSSQGYTGTLSIGAALHVDFDLQVENTATLDNRPIGLVVGNYVNDVRITGGFYRTTSTSGTTAGNVCGVALLPTTNCTFRMRNATCVSADGLGFRNQGPTTTGAKVYVYNCTIVNRSANAYTLLDAASPSGVEERFKNCILQGPGSALYSVSYSAPDEKLTILTQDATGTTGLTSKTLTFVDATNWDYHLASGDTDAIGAATDLSADSYWPFSTDGDGNSRPNGAWDVGAHEYGAGAPPAGRPAWRNVTRVADRALAAARV